MTAAVIPFPTRQYAPDSGNRKKVAREGNLLASLYDSRGVGLTREAVFERFVADHSRELGRLAYLMVGDRDAADDLTADALLVAWRQWDTVQAADRPLAYLRRVVINLAATRVRRLVRERRRLVLFQSEALEVDDGADSAAVVDVRSALVTLPAGRRACVVLRYAFDLSEQEVSALLGISVGTVKSQTAKGAEQLRRTLRAAGEQISGTELTSSLHRGRIDGTA
jgi:RNA polymerase sigma-70 factor (sigma-E family)